MGTIQLKKIQARKIWIQAQRLDVREPFGSGANAVRKASEHLGYVQIDTIHVIERAHHHILFTRIPKYRQTDLGLAQSQEKSVFEYWTHALSYVPTRDIRFFLKEMRDFRCKPSGWFKDVTLAEIKKTVRQIRDQGPVSIRDIKGGPTVEKVHPWASRKPAKRVLEAAFYAGFLTVSERLGMVKKYELLDRHLGWMEKPDEASPTEYLEYLLQRSLRAQGIVSVDSICYLCPSIRAEMRVLIESEAKRKRLVEVEVEGVRGPHWALPKNLEDPREPTLTHILSPFDPLVIQRKRLAAFFDYEHLFEAYLPKEKRRFGYFALPILVGTEVVATIDIKTDREQKKLLINHWRWLGRFKSSELRDRIELELDRFEKFQLQVLLKKRGTEHNVQKA